jgi:diguanylate cyclase (GGDEF)-like protein/PAS domain S-box-containing protein
MRILYVEDDARDADLACRELKKAGPKFEVEVVATLRDARVRLEQIPLPYDLVLTDISLPDGNGMLLLGHIRAHDLPLPVVMVTGAGDEETVVTALRAGASDYIVKRGEYLRRLPATLSSALDHFRTATERRSRPLRVLYAEHDANDIDLVRRHLARHAPQLLIEIAHSTSQIFDRMPAHGPKCDYDLLLLDYRLPGMNGLEVLKELRQVRALDLTIVIVSGQGDEEIAAQALKLGAVDYLVKGSGYLHRLPMVLENAYFRAELMREQAALHSSEIRFRSLMEQSPFSIQVLSPDGQTLQVNPAWEHLWGMKAEALAGYDILQDPQLVDKGVMPYIKKGFTGEATEIPPIAYHPSPVVRGPASDRWIRAYIYPLKDEAGTVREVILMHEDVTEKKHVEDAIRLIAAGVSSETGASFFRGLVTQLAKIFDADYAFIGVLDKLEPLTVTTLAAFAHGQIASNMTYPLEATPCKNVMGQQTCVYPQGVRQLFPEDTLLQDMGAESYIGTPLFDSAGQALGLIAVLDSKPMQDSAMFVDILEIFAARSSAEIQRLRAEEYVQRMAFHDYLTGMPNRAKLHAHLSEAIEQSKNRDGHGAVLLIDLDHFKTINDALGHEMGDLVLREVARQLEEIVTGRAFAARMGGDEFIAVIADNDPDDETASVKSRQLAEDIMAKLAAPFTVGERILNIGASIGIALFPQPGATTLDALRCVDMALYRAKEMGRNNIQFFLPAMQALADERLLLERGLHQALANKELVLNFQPQLNSTGQVTGAEVLLRWHHPERGVIMPETFIPVAEESGVIHLVGEWVLDHACERLAGWADTGIPFHVHLSVNVSPWQFAHPDFVQKVRRIVAKHSADPRQLMLEITESALLDDLEETISKLEELRSMGIRTSLDDFGTGYSSLSYLKDLPLDELKIDQSFVKQLGPGSNNPLVEAIIAVGQHLGLEVIGEGVESAMQQNILNEMGCHNFQGYLFSHPLPEKEFLVWLGKNQVENGIIA